MSTLYHKLSRLSRAKTEFYCKTSAPKKPIKHAPINNNKNVICSPFHSIIYYRPDQPLTFRQSPEKPDYFVSLATAAVVNIVDVGHSKQITPPTGGKGPGSLTPHGRGLIFPLLAFLNRLLSRQHLHTIATVTDTA